MKFSTFWLNVGHQKSQIFGIALFGWKKSNTNEPNLNLNIRVSKCYEMDRIRIYGLKARLKTVKKQK